jgi:8-oxo-dGTP pyrophosphatase MutT (NUDIX family)
VTGPGPRRGGDQVIPRPASWLLGPPGPWASGWVPTVDALIANLRPHAHPLLPSFPDARHSAVLVVLTDAGTGPEVLLTRRSWEVSTHRGEISFPGGRIDPGESALEAALREAEEEVGLDRSLVTVCGELEHLNTVVSRSYIVPEVATVENRLELHPCSPEVARVMWVPLAELTRPDAHRSEQWGEQPSERLLHFFELDDETVWGATARVLVDLLTRALPR